MCMQKMSAKKKTVQFYPYDKKFYQFLNSIHFILMRKTMLCYSSISFKKLCIHDDPSNALLPTDTALETSNKFFFVIAQESFT